MRNRCAWLLLPALVLGGCGGDGLRLSLPDGNQVRYLSQKPSGRNFNVNCDAKNASVWASNEERNSMRLRCVATLADASGQTLPAAASIRLVAEVTEQGHKPEDGSEVHFVTDKGSFAPFGPDNPEAVTEIDVGTQGGLATASLYTYPGSSGEARVTASYQTIGSKNVSDSTRVVVSEGLRAMVESNCPIVRYADETTPFSFLIAPSCEPADVEPQSGEGSHMDGGIIHNPRDGILTVVFAVDGEEGFIDSNNNGSYDSGEPFAGFDVVEPFVDVNDSGSFDEGEPYLDVDGDGQWSDANGKWDSDAVIWKATHIMFSGRPHLSAKTTHFEPSGINIQAGGSQALILYLMDINMNPIPGGGDGWVRFNVEGGAEISGDSDKVLKDVLGASFTDDGKIIVQSLQQDRSYNITLDDGDPGAPEPVTLKTTIDWRPAPENEEYSPAEQSEILPEVTGTAQ